MVLSPTGHKFKVEMYSVAKLPTVPKPAEPKISVLDKFSAFLILSHCLILFTKVIFSSPRENVMPQRVGRVNH